MQLWIIGGHVGNEYHYGGGLDITYYSRNDMGFRPVVVLNYGYTLEKTKDVNNNDAFKIVEE